jgi:hypothetical protein
MNLPSYNAEASLYRSTVNYQSVCVGGKGPGFGQEASWLVPQLPPLPNGGGGCKPHFGPCTVPDSTCPTGFSRVICGTDCECDTFCCTKPCPVTCGPCTGGQCNAYPNCGPVPGSGTQNCTDCHGNPSTRSC